MDKVSQLKTQYIHIHFEYRARGSDESKKHWCCINNQTGFELGYVYFYRDWNTNVFIPERTSLFSASCLEDIAEFLTDLNATIC